MKQRIPSGNSYSLIVMFCGFTVYGMTVTGGCVQVPIVFIRQYDLLQTICRTDIPFSRGCESLLLSKGILMKVVTKHRLLVKHFNDVEVFKTCEWDIVLSKQWTRCQIS